MNERIRKVRKHFNLTQTEFGKRIGVAGNTVTNYESGNREPSNAVITSICREFGIDEVWLRTGDGGPESMLSKTNPDDKYTLSLAKLTTSENQFVRNAVNYLAEAEPEKIKIIEDFMKECLGVK